MEFDWTPEQDAYRERVRALLARELPDDWERIAVHGPGSDAQTEFSRHFCPILAREGLFVPHWPHEYGGEELSTWLHFILGEELWALIEPHAHGPETRASGTGHDKGRRGVPRATIRRAIEILEAL